MKTNESVLKGCVRGMTAFALVALATQGCAVGVDEGTGEFEQDDSIVTSEEALHTYPGVPLLSWRGAPPQASQLTSNQPGLQVVYSLDVGVTSKTIVGLQVCWYTPSNPNNLFTQGDPFGCNIIGKTTATKWTKQTCPGDQVVSGYTTKANSSNTKIVKFGTMCKSLSNPSQFTNFPTLGDPDVLFSDILSCPNSGGVPGYMEFFNSNNNFTGFNGACVLR